jgi:hypothetical protein
VFNAKIVVGGRVTGIHWIVDTRRVWVWIQIHTHERLWVRVWVEFCLVGMDSRTIYLCTTRLIAIPMSSPLSNSAPVLRGALCPSSLIREASPARRCYADLGCQGARRLLQQRTLVVPSTTSVMFLGPHVGAQYPCTCPP